jgi:hypothetical protein
MTPDYRDGYRAALLAIRRIALAGAAVDPSARTALTLVAEAASVMLDGLLPGSATTVRRDDA